MLNKQITYHDNGNICEESFYKDGIREGECTTYYKMVQFSLQIHW